jgi:hypothetical protein
VATAVFGVLLTRQSGGYEASKAAQTAIRRRRIPDDVDPDVVRQGLLGFRRVQRRLVPWLTGVLALIAVGLLVLAVVSDLAAAWGACAAVATLTASFPLLLRSRLRRVDALLAELDRRQAADGASVDE